MSSSKIEEKTKHFWSNCSESFKRSFLVIFAFGFSFGIGFLFQWGILSIRFYVSEQAIYAIYEFTLKDLIDLLVTGPVFTLVSFFLIKRILDELSGSEISEKAIITYYMVFVIAIVMFNYGNIIHVTMNRLYNQIKNDYNAEDVYYSVVFLDEIIGHLLLNIGFFIFITEVCFLHTKSLNFSFESNQKTALLLKSQKERFWNFFMGMLLGISTALAYIEGQCAFVFLILNPIFAFLLFMHSKYRDVEIKENSILVLYLLMTIFYAITILVWVLFTGLIPVYPYFYQLLEYF